MFSSVGLAVSLSLVLHGVLHGSMRDVKYGTNISWCYLGHIRKKPIVPYMNGCLIDAHSDRRGYA